MLLQVLELMKEVTEEEDDENISSDISGSYNHCEYHHCNGTVCHYHHKTQCSSGQDASECS